MIDGRPSDGSRASTRPHQLLVRIRRGVRFLQDYPILPGAILSVLILSAIFAPIVAPYDPIRDADFANVRNPPIGIGDGDASHLLGTDHIGRDLLSRVIYGGRVSLLVAAVSISCGMFVGTALGLISGYVGGQVDEIIMRLVDMWHALPFLMLALVIAIVLGQSFGVMFLLLALVAWVSFVRPVRGEVLSLKSREYVASAKIVGASPFRIMFRHMLPGVINTVIVIATLRAGGLVLTESVLSYLGVGIPPPTPTWGGMVADGRGNLDTAWWIATIPGVAIFLLVLSLNFIGDWLRDRFDPRLRQS